MASPRAASTAASQPVSTSTRSSNVPTMPSRPANRLAPARALAASNAVVRASVRAAHARSSPSCSRKRSCTATSAASVTNRTPSAVTRRSVATLIPTSPRSPRSAAPPPNSVAVRWASAPSRARRNSTAAMRCSSRDCSLPVADTAWRAPLSSPRTCAAVGPSVVGPSSLPHSSRKRARSAVTDSSCSANSSNWGGSTMVSLSTRSSSSVMRAASASRVAITSWSR